MDCCRRNLFKTDPACEEVLTRPKPCKIILPPKRRHGAFDDLRLLGFFTYVGNILTFLIAFFFVLSVLEYILNQQLQLRRGRPVNKKLDNEPETGTDSSKKVAEPSVKNVKPEGSQEPKREEERVPGKASVTVMPEKEQEYVPQRNQERVPDKVQENSMPEKEKQNVPKRDFEKLPDKVSEKLPERVPENEPANVPQDRLEKMPGNQPERLSEPVPKAGQVHKHGGRKAPCHSTHGYSGDTSWFDFLFYGINN